MVDLIFTVAPHSTVAEATRALKDCQVRVTSTLDEIGMILAQADMTKLGELKQLPQFESVDVDRSVSIAPPDAPLQ